MQYLKLHYSLIPYIYSHIWEQHNTGVGPIRPLPLEFQDVPHKVYLNNKSLPQKKSEAELLASKKGWFYANGLIKVMFSDAVQLNRLGLGSPVKETSPKTGSSHSSRKTRETK